MKKKVGADVNLPFPEKAEKIRRNYD